MAHLWQGGERSLELARGTCPDGSGSLYTNSSRSDARDVFRYAGYADCVGAPPPPRPWPRRRGSRTRTASTARPCQRRGSVAPRTSRRPHVATSGSRRAHPSARVRTVRHQGPPERFGRLPRSWRRSGRARRGQRAAARGHLPAHRRPGGPRAASASPPTCPSCSRRSTSTRPDVVVTDIRMPPTGTDEGIRAAALAARAPPVHRASSC